MSDQNPAAQNSPFPQSSYVDSYQPPVSQSQPPQSVAAPIDHPTADQPATQEFISDVPNFPPAQDSSQSSSDDDVAMSTPNVNPSAAAPANDQRSGVSQALEDQNIFHLLGVQGSDEEKERFLDELQQVIWEDFLSQDVELLITEEEQEELRKIMAQKTGTDVEQQERILTFLDGLIPDLEEIMLEKALELKEDMVKERMAGMRIYYAQDEKALAKIDEVAALIADDQWRAAADTLNSIE